jgi:hypothetical protein
MILFDKYQFSQATVSAVGTSLYYLSVFLSSQIPGLLEHSIGMPGMFLVFALISAIYLGTVFYMVPETYGTNYHQYTSDNKKEIKI